MHSKDHNFEGNEMWFSLLGVALVTLMYLLFVEFALNIPDVHTSNSTGECVTVINYDEDDQFSCENLPPKYNHVWVQ